MIVSQLPFKITGMDLSGYMVKDAARAIAFYRDILGLEPVKVYPDDLGAEYELADGTTFGPVERRRHDSVPTQQRHLVCGRRSRCRRCGGQGSRHTGTTGARDARLPHGNDQRHRGQQRSLAQTQALVTLGAQCWPQLKIPSYSAAIFRIFLAVVPLE